MPSLIKLVCSSFLIHPPPISRSGFTASAQAIEPTSLIKRSVARKKPNGKSQSTRMKYLCVRRNRLDGDYKSADSRPMSLKFGTVKWLAPPSDGRIIANTSQKIQFAPWPSNLMENPDVNPFWPAHVLDPVSFPAFSSITLRREYLSDRSQRA